MIQGIVGFPRAGKTYYSVAKALDAMKPTRKFKSGRPVYANFDIKGAERLSESDPSSLFRVRPGSLVILDEAHLFYGSRAWKDFSESASTFFSQSGKLSLDLIWTAQDSLDVEVQIRRKSEYVTRMTPFLKGVVGHPLFFSAKTYYGARNLDKDKFLAWSSMVRYKKSVADAYDTLQILKMEDLT